MSPQAIFQDRTECTTRCCLNLLHNCELILDCRAVSTILSIAPCNDGTIFQDRSKRTTRCCMNLLHTCQLILDCRAVSTIMSIAPCNDGTIFQDPSKWIPCGLNLVHTLQLILDCRAVTTTTCSAPGDDGAIFQDRSKWTHQVWPESAAHSAADIGHPSCQHRMCYCPMLPQSHLPGSQRMQILWLEPAALFSADVELQSCHRLNMDRPM